MEFKELEEIVNEYDSEILNQNDYADAMDHDALRADILKAQEEMDDAELAVSIDFARTLGKTYPYAYELEEAENRLYAMMLLCAAPETNDEPASP